MVTALLPEGSAGGGRLVGGAAVLAGRVSLGVITVTTVDELSSVVVMAVGWTAEVAGGAVARDVGGISVGDTGSTFVSCADTADTSSSRSDDFISILPGLVSVALARAQLWNSSPYN